MGYQTRSISRRLKKEANQRKKDAVGAAKKSSGAKPVRSPLRPIVNALSKATGSLDTAPSKRRDPYEDARVSFSSGASGVTWATFQLSPSKSRVANPGFFSKQGRPGKLPRIIIGRAKSCALLAQLQGRPLSEAPKSEDELYQVRLAQGVSEYTPELTKYRNGLKKDMCRLFKADQPIGGLLLSLHDAPATQVVDASLARKAYLPSGLRTMSKPIDANALVLAVQSEDDAKQSPTMLLGK